MSLWVVAAAVRPTVSAGIWLIGPQDGGLSGGGVPLNC
jgi:hypothetical protein